MRRASSTRTSNGPVRVAAASMLLIVAVVLPARSLAQTDTTGASPQPAVAPAGPLPDSPNAAPGDGTWFPVPMSGAAPALSSRRAPHANAAHPDRTESAMGSRQKHSLVFDSRGQRFIAFGGWPGGASVPVNDLWQRPLASGDDWVAMNPAGTAPPARADHVAIYDPDGDRMIVFGGRGTSGPLNDVWVLALGSSPQWSEVHPAGSSPSPRYAHTAILDRERHRIVIFGGRSASAANNEVWLLDLSGGMSWAMAVLGPSMPPQRAEHVAIDDAAHARMVVYGGTGTSHYGDVWTLSLAAPMQWTFRVGNSPPGNREGGVADVDPAGNRMILFGGAVGTTYRNDLWQLDLSSFAWLQLNPSSGAPLARRDPAFAVDPVSRTGVLSGGLTDQATVPDEAFELQLDPPLWTRLLLPPPPPPPQLFPLDLVGGLGADRGGAGSAFDPSHQRYLLVGGDASNYGAALRNDVQELILGRDSTWKSRAVYSTGIGVVFTPRFGHTIVIDTSRQRLILFGGFDGNYRNDLWTISLGETLVCAPLSSVGGSPTPRDFHSAVYDPVGDRMIVFGGNGSFGPLNDVWELRLGGVPTWGQLATTGTPPSARLAHQAIYDPVFRRVLVFGGYDGSAVRNDLWQLSLDSVPGWTSPNVIGALPPARHSHTMIYDSNRQRLVLFGGVDGSQSFGDVWQLPLGGPSLTWGRLAPDGTSPSPRYGALALFDPVGDRMLVSGGWDQGITQPQVRRLQWSMSPTPTALALESFEAQPDLVRLSWDVPSGASSFVLERRVPAGSWVECSAEREASVPLTLVDHTVTAASRYGYRLLAFSGAGVTTSAEVWLETPPPISLTLDGFVPNPVARSPRVRFTAAAHMRARIEILDVTGRRRAAREIEAGGSGGQTIEFPGVALSPGVYLVRLRAEGITLVRRGIVVR